MIPRNELADAPPRTAPTPAPGCAATSAPPRPLVPAIPGSAGPTRDSCVPLAGCDLQDCQFLGSREGGLDGLELPGELPMNESRLAHEHAPSLFLCMSVPSVLQVS